jgi:hypothetical protein
VLPAIARVVASNIVRYVKHGGLDAPGLQRASRQRSAATSPLAPASDTKGGILTTGPGPRPSAPAPAPAPATATATDSDSLRLDAPPFGSSKRGIPVASEASTPAKPRDSAAVAPAPGDAQPPPPASAGEASPLPHPLLRRVPTEIGWASTRQERAKRDFVARFARLAGYSYGELLRRSQTA